MVNIAINGQDFSKYLQTVEIQRDAEDTDNDNVIGVATIKISDIDGAVSDILSLPLPGKPDRIAVEQSVTISKNGDPLFTGRFDLGNIDSDYFDNDNFQDSRSLTLQANDNLKDVAETWDENKPYPLPYFYDKFKISSQTNFVPAPADAMRGGYLMPLQAFLMLSTRVPTYIETSSDGTVRTRLTSLQTFFHPASLDLPVTQFPLINVTQAQSLYLDYGAWLLNSGVSKVRTVGPSRGNNIPDYSSVSVLDLVTAICEFRDGRVLCLPNGNLIYAEKWQPTPLGTLLPTAVIDTYTTLGVYTFPTKTYLGYPNYNPWRSTQYSPGYYSTGTVPGNVGCVDSQPLNTGRMIDLTRGIFAANPGGLFCSGSEILGNAGHYQDIGWEFNFAGVEQFPSDSARAISLVKAMCQQVPTRFKILTSGYNYFPLQQAILSGKNYTITSTTIRPIEDEAELIVEAQNQYLLTGQ